MAVSKVSLVVGMIIALLYTVVLPSVHAQSTAPAPAPASDGKYIFLFLSRFGLYLFVGR